MGDVIRVATLENQFEAQLLEVFLNEQEIAYAIQSFHDSAYDGLFQAQYGWGVVEADESNAEAIRSFLEDLRKEKETL